MSQAESTQGLRVRPKRDSWLSIEMRHLAALVAVAREASFSGAADSLGYVPTAVSRQVAHLESLVGDRLTARDGSGRSMSLTAQGALLAGHAKAILGELCLARQEIGASPHGSASGLSLGIASLFGDWLPTAFVRSTNSMAQASSISVRRDRSHGLLRMLEAGALDAALLDLPIRSGPFSALELVSDPCVLALPRIGTLPGDVPLLEIADCRAIIVLRARLKTPAPRYVVESPAAALAFVRAGVASAVVARSDIQPGVDVCVVPMDDVPPRVIGLAWHRDRDGDPALDELREFARAAVGPEPI